MEPLLRLGDTGMGEQEIREKLRGWIRDLCGRDIADDTPIFESGLLSSLDVVELILFIESINGDEIDLEIMDPDVFTSIDTILAGFFERRSDG